MQRSARRSVTVRLHSATIFAFSFGGRTSRRILRAESAADRSNRSVRTRVQQEYDKSTTRVAHADENAALAMPALWPATAEHRRAKHSVGAVQQRPTLWGLAQRRAPRVGAHWLGLMTERRGGRHRTHDHLPTATPRGTCRRCLRIVADHHTCGGHAYSGAAYGRMRVDSGPLRQVHVVHAARPTRRAQNRLCCATVSSGRFSLT